jgi:hypothetical protein
MTAGYSRQLIRYVRMYDLQLKNFIIEIFLLNRVIVLSRYSYTLYHHHHHH